MTRKYSGPIVQRKVPQIKFADIAKPLERRETPLRQSRPAIQYKFSDFARPYERRNGVAAAIAAAIAAETIPMLSFREKLVKGADRKIKENHSQKTYKVSKKIAAPVQERLIKKLNAEQMVIDAIADNAVIPDAAEGVLDHSHHPEINPDDYHEDKVIIDDGDDKRRMVRAMKQTETDKVQRVQNVISRGSTAATYNPNDSTHDRETTAEFNHSSLILNNNSNPDIHDVNAVQMVMENILDWDHHAHYHGETLTHEVYKTLIKSLKMNLETACPSAVPKKFFDNPDAHKINSENRKFISLGHDVLDLYELLATKNWIGDLPHVYERTQQVVAAFLSAQNGDLSHLEEQKADMERIAIWYQRHYYEVEAKAVSEAQIASLLERQALN